MSNTPSYLSDILTSGKLNYNQKLQALANRFYALQEWKPAIGDFYTTSRADLEVYQVVNIDDEYVYTSYIPLGGIITKWNKEEFTTEGFGPKRVHIPTWVIEHY